MRRRQEDRAWLVSSGAGFLGAELLGEGRSIARQRGWMPRVDVLEGEDHVLVRAELAGVLAEHVHVRFVPERRSLVLRGARSDDATSSAPGYRAHLLEIEEGVFSREVVLPEVSLELDRMKASLRGGILSVVIPKGSDEGTVFVVRTITVQRGS